VEIVLVMGLLSGMVENPSQDGHGQIRNRAVKESAELEHGALNCGLFVNHPRRKQIPRTM
jgi:hypothetical protein